MKQEDASKLSEKVAAAGMPMIRQELDAARPDIYAALVQHGKGKVTITLEFDGTRGKPGEMHLECQAATKAECPAVKTPGNERTVLPGDPLPGMESEAGT